MPVARDRAVDQFWIDRMDVVITESEFLETPGPKVFDKDIGRHNESAEYRLSSLCLEINR